MRPTYMRGGWRKGTCFQEWRPVISPGKCRGQPGGGVSPGAAPAFSIVPHTTLHTRPRRPQSSIYCLDLAATELNSTSSALLQKGGCFACAPFFPQGGHLASSPSSGVLSRGTQLLSFPRRGLPRPCHLNELYSDCSKHQCPDPISQRKIWSPRPSGQECERRAYPPCLQEPFGFRWECHAIQKGIYPHRAGFELALH